jgi:hypothetical protein
MPARIRFIVSLEGSSRSFCVVLPADATVGELREDIACQLKTFSSAVTLKVASKDPPAELQSDHAFAKTIGGGGAITAHLRKDVSTQLSHMRKALADQLQHELLLTASKFDFTSMREKRAFKHHSEGEKVKAKHSVGTIALLFNCDDPSQSCNSITLDGEKLQPYRLLENNAGVELRGIWGFSWVGPTKEDTEKHMQQLERHAKDIAHCRKLLRDLPVALKNSLEALDTASTKSQDELDLTELGAMVLEQRRIKDEIQSQQQQLSKLLEIPPPDRIPASSFVLRKLQSSLTLPFGRQTIDGGQYIVAPIAKGIVQQAEVELRDLKVIEEEA